jgi:succinate-semialdehyde dehydrogenase / glutarate-semialdehyde dehydrogenase
MTPYPNKNFINGEWREASSGDTFPVINPATGETLTRVPALTQHDVDEAIHAANAALKGWGELAPRKRSDILLSIAQALTAKTEELARLITAEQGKPLAESRGEVAYSASYFRWFSEEAVRVNGDIIPADSPSKRIFVLRQPIGVVAAITPWNFPIAMLARKMAAALAAGCTFIAKPAPETPLSALALAEICSVSGVPAGVVNIITGDAEMIGGTLMCSPIIRKITFTGSTEVGKLLMRQSADTVKKLTLELGGNAPFIVFDDADLTKAVEGAIYGKYRNAGQTCICVNRFLVHEKIAREFTERLIARSKELTLGDGSAPGTTVGPLISDDAVAKVSRLISSAHSEGATIALAPAPHPSGPRFVAPTVITGVTPEMSIWKEEIFGPVSAITTFTSDEQAITLANDTPHGLAAYLYSSNLSRALQVSERLDYGMVGINDTAISAAQAPFGGIKQSGFGREGSKYGIEDYLVLKYVAVGMG